MNLSLWLHGHVTSCWPALSGAPTECTARTKAPFEPRTSSAGLPIRVMIRIDAATRGESVSSTPSLEIAPPSGPIENGTTYMVRPSMAPLNSLWFMAFCSSGARQLFVGPDSSLVRVFTHVLSSERATSDGSDRIRYEFGRSFSFSLIAAPFLTIEFMIPSNSALEPSHTTTLAGLRSAAYSATYAASSE
eukprot:Amastigsp_a174349_697.p7 type:complete len:190 gc:universal Amastigsp_a174349_697:1258-1827(+)